MNATTETVEAIRALYTTTMASWSGCVDTGCGESHDAAREAQAQDAADAAEGHWDRAIEAVESGDLATAKQELEWARSLASEWGDSTCETQALEVVDAIQAGGDDEDEDDDEDVDDCYIMTCASGSVVLVSAESAEHAEEAWDAEAASGEADPRVTGARPSSERMYMAERVRELENELRGTKAKLYSAEYQLEKARARLAAWEPTIRAVRRVIERWPEGNVEAVWEAGDAIPEEHRP